MDFVPNQLATGRNGNQAGRGGNQAGRGGDQAAHETLCEALRRANRWLETEEGVDLLNLQTLEHRITDTAWSELLWAERILCTWSVSCGR